MIVFKYLFFKTSNIKSSSCLNYCVATLQGWAGPWYSSRQNNIHGAIGIREYYSGIIREYCLECLYL